MPKKLRGAAGFFGMFLLVSVDAVPNPPPDAIVQRVRAAVAVANGAVPARTVVGTSTAASRRGVAVAVFSNSFEHEASSEWLDALVNALRVDGLQGKVGTPRTQSPGLDELTSLPRTYPTAFVGYRLEHYTPLDQPMRGWHVDPATTRRVTEGLQAWARRFPDCETWASLHGGFVPIPADGTADFLSGTAAVSQWIKQVCYVPSDRSAAHCMTLGDIGESVSGTGDPNADWRSLLDAQIQNLLIAPDAADVGMIKNAGAMSDGWDRADLVWRDLHRTVRLTTDYETNRHLWDEYVIDAAGVNLLTDKHLSHAHDLSDWTVEEVAHDRYLVSSLDLEAWFGDLAADPDTIAKARSDFGDMILSWDTILASPGPYNGHAADIAGR